MSKKSKLDLPLTRWNYFFKTLYHDPSERVTVEFNKIIYAKSDELMAIEDGNARIHTLLLMVLMLMFLTGIKFQNIWIFVIGMIVIVVGEVVRMMRLPKHITDHLTDTGRRKR